MKNSLNFGLKNKLGIFLCGIILLALIGCTTKSTKASADAFPNGNGFLLVADVAMQHLYVYRLPDMVMTGEVPNVHLGAHMGTLTLPDGRILLSDDTAKEILALRIDNFGVPTIVNRVAVTIGLRAVWASTDPQFQYLAVSSQISDSTVNLIDLQTFENTEFPVEMEAEEETHPYLGGQPPSLFVGLGGVMRSYNVDELIRDGGMAEPTSETPLDFRSHGLVNSPEARRLGITTQAGLNVIDTDCAALDKPVCETENVPWDIDGRQGGQNYRPRLASDGITVLGAIAGAAPSPEQWADTPQDVHVVNMKTLEAHRFPLGTGIIPRFALSQTYAVFVTIHPYGDELHLLDVRPMSSTYLKWVGAVFLNPLSNGPVDGQPTTGRERRFVGVTPDGRYAFATHGGDGKISVIDTVSLEVMEMAVPTTLQGGGYMTAYQPGAPITDIIAR